ncbi:DUF58 domain-containing protein [Alkaliphilus transvaalensis]|uniref:DUF58 domain-containing protein n=1 Tax=Alkaliphilus transvaalensis TaxID=114628 RepID=UPI0004790E79|nr:DUF58 domain-containing protein [Alkaliphilus transvaalensis]
MVKILVIILTFAMINYALKKWEAIAYYQLKVKRRLENNKAFPNEQLEMITEITNKKILPLTWVEIETTIPEELTIRGEHITIEKEGAATFYKHFTIFSLLMYQRIKRKHTISFSKRGKYMFTDFKVKTSDYFGFKNYERDFKCPVEVLVYPKLYPVEGLLLDSKSYLGDTTIKRWIIEDPTYFNGTRPYTYREPLKKIHWKATSRTGEIQVKEQQYTSDLSVIFVVNIPFNKYLVCLENEEAIEELIEVTATYIDLAQKKGISFGLATNSLMEGEGVNGAIIPPGVDIKQLNRTFDLLAKIKLASFIPVERIIDEITSRYLNTCVISILTTEFNEELLAAISRGRSKGFSFEVTSYAETIVDFNEIYKFAKVNLIEGGGKGDAKKSIQGT